MSQSKYLKLNKDILIEWIYSEQDIKDDYQILYNKGSRSYLGTTTNNNINNTYFTIDPILNKYTKVDTNKYNFLQTKDYDGYNIKYDTVKIFFPVGYDLGDNLGFLMNLYVYDDNGEKTYNISNFIYRKNDINMINSSTKSFMYDEKQWQNYILLKIPSVNEISLERYFTNTNNNNDYKNQTEPLDDTINSNLVEREGRGVNQTHPIFIDFSFIVKEEVVFNTVYYYGGDITHVSLSKTAEYSKLSCNIKESTEGDFFEISGLYGGNRSGFENFMNDRILMGRNYVVEYSVNLYEENILQSTQTFSITDNFSLPIYYRPIIMFSNTTAMIDLNMKLIDRVDDSVIFKKSTLGLTKNINKYGRRLSAININNASKPKIYNLKSNANINNNDNVIKHNGFSGINITKVNFPLLYENLFVLVKSTNSNNSKYKSSGMLEILISPFNTTFKFNIARGIKNGNDIEPLDLSEMLINAKLRMVFKSDNLLVEKEVYLDSVENKLEQGIVVFNIENGDVDTIKNISKDNNNFYLTIDGEYSDTKSLLYSGKFYMYDDVNFIKHRELSSNGENGVFVEDTITKPNDIDFINSNNVNSVSNSEGIVSSNIIKTANNTIEKSETTKEKILVFINPVYKVSFESKLFSIINKSKQLHTSYNNTYLIFDITKKMIAEIEKITGMLKYVTFK